MLWLAASTLISPRLSDSGVSILYFPIAILFFLFFVSRSLTDILSAVVAYVASALCWVVIGGHPIVASLPYLLVDLVEAGALAWCLRRWVSAGLSLRRPFAVTLFIAAVLFVSSLSAAVASALSAVIEAELSVGGVKAWRFWRDWFFGSAVSHVTLGAALLMVRRLGSLSLHRMVHERPIELSCSVLALLLAVLYDFGVLSLLETWVFGVSLRQHAPHPALLFLTLPAVIWLSFSFLQLGATIGILLTAIPSLHMVAEGYGPIWLEQAVDRVLVMQAYIGISALVAFYVAALASQVRHREQLLKRALRLAHRRARDRADFIGTFNHEMRTPLNGILGFTQLMQSEIDGPLTPRYREFVDSIDRSAKRLLHMVTEILNLNRMQSGGFEIAFAEVRPYGIAEDIKQMMAGLAEREGVTIVNAVPPDLALSSDEQALNYALANIVSNALRHTPAGGEISIAAQTSSERTTIEVADTGCGFEPDEILYGDRYARGDERAGLGLRITDTIMSLHEGRMLINSKPGQGTRVCLIFPRERQAKRGARAAPALSIAGSPHLEREAVGDLSR